MLDNTSRTHSEHTVYVQSLPAHGSFQVWGDDAVRSTSSLTRRVWHGEIPSLSSDDVSRCTWIWLTEPGMKRFYQVQNDGRWLCKFKGYDACPRTVTRKIKSATWTFFPADQEWSIDASLDINVSGHASDDDGKLVQSDPVPRFHFCYPWMNVWRYWTAKVVYGLIMAFWYGPDNRHVRIVDVARIQVSTSLWTDVTTYFLEPAGMNGMNARLCAR